MTPGQLIRLYNRTYPFGRDPNILHGKPIKILCIKDTSTFGVFGDYVYVTEGTLGIVLEREKLIQLKQERELRVKILRVKILLESGQVVFVRRDEVTVLA